MSVNTGLQRLDSTCRIQGATINKPGLRGMRLRYLLPAWVPDRSLRAPSPLWHEQGPDRDGGESLPAVTEGEPSGRSPDASTDRSFVSVRPLASHAPDLGPARAVGQRKDTMCDPQPELEYDHSLAQTLRHHVTADYRDPDRVFGNRRSAYENT